jgi:predicted nicotinamide N-methyase
MSPGFPKPCSATPQLAERQAFIRGQTSVRTVPGLPLNLYQASEVTPLWLMTEEDLARAQLSPPFWAFPWAGGQALARYVLENPDIVAGKRVVDIACGSGLVGIAAAKAGAAHVIANDVDAYCEAAVALNAELNNVTIVFCGDDLLTGAAPDPDILGADVFLAGDICYEKPMADAMLTFFRRLNAESSVYIGDPHRNYFPKDGLHRCADYDIVTAADIEDAPIKPAAVWKLEK